LTFERAARYGEGWITAAGPAAAFSEGREAWHSSAAQPSTRLAYRPRSLATLGAL
jgi:alkanesulfonate monooxygenase SsuD/methylene tetrahydromethanopterin reductase-like flavin-dependent oxidoreductase (luciferase family)